MYTVSDHIPAEVFRPYDIRGPVGDNSINSNLSYAIGLAFGSLVRRRGQHTVMIGRDGRLTGEAIQGALMQGLCECGCDVVNLGVISTPMLYFAASAADNLCGIMVTASHNPAGDNGFKSVLEGRTLTSEGVQAIYQCIIKRDFVKGQGCIQSRNILPEYIAAITHRIDIDRPLKVVVDCGNGVGAIAAPETLRRLGCEVIELYCEVDGRFPNHHPDPTVPANLQDLIDKVQCTNADCGLAFDGDADRVGVVTDKGEVIWPDRLMMLFAAEVLSRRPKSDVIYDVKCSSNLTKLIKQYGGNPIMYKTGHSLIKSKMKEINAPLAGEMSGHIFFNDEWFGFDDGLYVAARLLRILGAQSQSCSDMFSVLPNSYNTPELKLPMAESDKESFMQRLVSEGSFPDGEFITIDGLRVDFGFGWGLVRPSNTSPYLILRFEADSQENLEKIQLLFRSELLRLDEDLKLPF